MRKIIFNTVITICTLTNSFSQDMITKKTSEDIKAKVIEVTINEIKYRKFDNLNGPLFTLLKSDVLMIRYENGSKDIFNEVQNSVTANASSNDMSIKGKEDAITNYKGKSSGAGWTAAATILTSPVLGLIPAIACSSTEPSDENLNYKDSELMKNNDYNRAYTKQAHKTKKKKIWTGFGVGSGAWLLLILLL
ncbi:hypothetical protein [Flavobacterium sp.]|jgi:hypothetical protein|uniref:hypothetical protein n=1 Tax=Flavobacterium sp. TaxID=239 RepID=UPI0037BE24B1